MRMITDTICPDCKSNLFIEYGTYICEICGFELDVDQMDLLYRDQI